MTGAFVYQSGRTKGATASDHQTGVANGLSFDASRVVPTALENRPYSITFLPLVAY